MTRRRAALVAAVVAALIPLVGLTVYRAHSSAEHAGTRRAAETVAHLRAEAVEKQLARAMSATHTLAAMLDLNERETLARFDAIASNLLDRFGGLDAVALAPGGVHTHVAPRAGYEAAIGLDLFADPVRRRQADAAIAARRLLVDGPLPTVTGTEAFFARLPVFLPPDSERFWGFVIGVVEVPTLARESALHVLEEEGYAWELALRRRDGRHVIAAGGRRPPEQPVVAALDVPGPPWELQLAPVRGWRDGGRDRVVPLLLLLAGAGVGVVLYRLLRHPAILQRKIDERTQELQTALIDSWLQRRELSSARDQLQHIVATTPDAVVAGTGDGTITEWNQAAERLYGWPREQMLGRHISQLLPQGATPLFERGLDALARGEMVVETVERVRRDGSPFQAELTLSGSTDEAGRLRSWVAIVRDVTLAELVREAREAMGSSLYPEVSLAAFGRALERIVGFEAVCLTETRGTIARRIACVGPDGAPLGRDTVPAEWGEIGKVLARRRTSTAVEHSGDPPKVVTRWVTSVPLLQGDEVVAVLSVGGSGVAAPAPSAIRLIEEAATAVTQDVSNILLYERQAETTRKLRELDELKSDFLSTVSHELRTPLTAIAGFASTLDDRWGEIAPGMRRNFVRRIFAKSRALDELIGELLDFSRLERGRMDVELKPCDLRTEIRRELAKLDVEIRDHPVVLDVPDGLLVLADPRAFARVLENLLSNAAKFSGPGTGISIGALEGREEVVVMVSDEGVGIPADEQERIFERFYRVNRGDRVAAGGTGIGLAIVRQFVEAQGGRVWVESAPGEGTTFFFSLRRARRSGDWTDVSLEVESPAEPRPLPLAASDEG